MNWFGIDIGGANIKCFNPQADQSSQAFKIPFAMWKHPERLKATLTELVASLETNQPISATMTGELADCFQSKNEGVRFIADALAGASGNRGVFFYSISGNFESVETVRRHPEQFAATNWLATANFASRFFDDGQGCLIDVGSTTTDIIPIRAGTVDLNRVGTSDFTRLQQKTLVYVGVKRTPVCGLVDRCLDLEIANELFATTLDAYLILKKVKEDIDSTNTADGRPASIQYAQQRLARMFCSDFSELKPKYIESLAALVDEQVTQRIRNAVMKNISDVAVTQFVVAGEGDWKATEILKQLSPGISPIRLSDKLGPHHSDCAPAVAVSTLAQDKLNHVR